MFCNTNQFPSFPFCGPHKKSHGVRGVGKHYHMVFDQKLGHGIFAIRRIPCACAECIYMLEKPWILGLTPQQQPRYQTFVDFTYWPVLGSFINWNIVKLSHKATTSEDFYDIHQVFLDGIRKNIASLVQPGEYGSMNTTDTSTMIYYVVKFFSEAYTLQYDTTYDDQISSSGEIVVKAQYLSCM